MSCKGSARRAPWTIAMLAGAGVVLVAAACGGIEGGTASNGVGGSGGTVAGLPWFPSGAGGNDGGSLVACPGPLVVPDAATSPSEPTPLDAGLCTAGTCATVADCQRLPNECGEGSWQSHGADLSWSFTPSECREGRCVFAVSVGFCVWDACSTCGSMGCTYGGPNPHCGSATGCSGPCGSSCFMYDAPGKCGLDHQCHISSAPECGDAGVTDAGDAGMMADGGTSDAQAAQEAGPGDADTEGG